MKRLFTLALMVMTVALLSSAQQKKKRVAVMDFDYATVRSGIAAIFGTDVDIGKGITDLIVDRLVNSGVYSVIERKAIDKILAEQNLSNSDRADPASAAKIARILGVDAIIIGSITQFGRDDQSTSVGGGAVGGITRKFGIGGVQRKEAKAVVGINARMIDTSTAEILGVASGKGESQRSGTSLLGAVKDQGQALAGVLYLWGLDASEGADVQARVVGGALSLAKALAKRQGALAPLWLVARVYLGYQWLLAGSHKVWGADRWIEVIRMSSCRLRSRKYISISC